jgi:tetratricopeptide (TPR) repeat protein
MLYQILCGRFPIDGSPVEILVNKQHKDPVHPLELNPEAPEDLSNLCIDLLRRSPSERPSDEEVLMRLCGLEMSAAAPAGTLESSVERPAVFAPPALVGRDEELRQLHAAFADCRNGRSVTVYLHGAPGTGKTALVRRFIDEILHDESVVVLTGRCHERESVPFKAFDSLVDALSRYLVHLPRTEAGELTPRDAYALARVFPVLERVPAIAEAPRRGSDSADPQRLRERAFSAIRELLTRIADRHPLVLFIDDFHWGDADSAALLADLTRPPDAPEILLLIAYRSEDVDACAPLAALLRPRVDLAGERDARFLEVRPLSFEYARELAAVLLADVDGITAGVAEAVARESRGNPYYVLELARSINVEGVAQVLSPSGRVMLEELVRARIDRLPTDARRLLEVVAIAGRPISLAIAAAASDLPDERRPAVIAVLRASHLLRTVGSEVADSLEIFENRIRETILDYMTAEQQGAAHARLVDSLVGADATDHEAIAMHAFAADRLEVAARHARLAGDLAVRSVAFDHAAQLYQFALDLLGPDSADAQQVRVSLAEALANAGRGARAAQLFLEASVHAPARQAMELRRRSAEEYLHGGHIDEGREVLAGVLRDVGLVYPRYPMAFLLCRLVRQWLRGGRFKQRDTSQVPDDLLQRVDTCWVATTGLVRFDIIASSYFQVVQHHLALDSGEPYRIARALASEALRVSFAGSRARRQAAKLAWQAETMGRLSGNPHAVGMARYAVGFAAYQTGEWSRAIEYFGQAEAIYADNCTGVIWEVNNVRVFLINSLYYLGELREMSRRLPLLLREAVDRGDLFAETTLLCGPGNVVWLAADDTATARQQIQEALSHWSRVRFQHQHYSAMYSNTSIELYEGADTALGGLLASWRQLAQSHLLRIQRLRVEALHLRGRAALAAAARTSDHKRLLRVVAGDVHRLFREDLTWADALASLLSAGLEWLGGRRDHAIASLEAGIAGCDLCGMKLYAAAGRWKLGHAASRPELTAEAEQWMATERIKRPERFADMLVPGVGDA